MFRTLLLANETDVILHDPPRHLCRTLQNFATETGVTVTGDATFGPDELGRG